MSFVTTDVFTVKSLKLLQGLVSHELIAYLSIFNQFKLNDFWSYYQKHANQIFLNHTTASQLMLKKDFFLHGTYLQKTLHTLTYVFDGLYLTQCLATFSSINHLLRLRARILIIYHLTQMRLSRSTHLPMFLSLETLISVIRTGLPILVEVIRLVNSVIIFLSQMILLRWLTFLLGFQTVILIVLLFWIYFFLLTLVFVLQWLFLHWEILNMLLSQIRLTFYRLDSGMPCFIALLMTTFVLLGMDFINIGEIYHGRISLSSVLLLLLVSFVSWFRLELIYIYPSQKTSSQASLTSMVFSCLCCGHSSQKLLFSFLPKV